MPAMCTSAASASQGDADAIRRRVMAWRIIIFGGLIWGIVTVNALSDLSEAAGRGRHLLPWKPFVWEYSSALVTIALIPALSWLNSRFAVSTNSWKGTIPLHLMATVPYSILHVSGMVGLRKFAYALAGLHYDFGTPLGTWFYEYRKDFVTYWLMLAALSGFRIYRQWLEMRAQAPVASSTPGTAVDGGLERLVVRKLNREFILRSADIDQIEADGNYVTIHARGTTYPLRKSLVALEKTLDPRRFVRIHRGRIVNVDRIREIQPWDSGDYRIVLADGSFVNFSRRYRNRLPQLFGA